MAAKHILVVADSCYSGALTRSSIGQLQPGLTDEAREQLVEADRRIAVADGADERRREAGHGRRRRQAFGFRREFHRCAVGEPGRARRHAAYREIPARVLDVALRQKFEQRPEYAAIRFAGGDSGDFLFVPKI